MSSSKPSIAFAGLGAMGYGMAVHLLKSGFQVVGYDVYAPALDRFAAEGGSSAATPREAAMSVQCLVCMVANSGQVDPLLFNKDIGAAEALPIDATIIMCATVAPAYIDVLRHRLNATRPDVRLIDSPVSGGAGRAAAGTLSIFASGDATHLASAQPVLECLSSKLYHVPGGLGAGSKAKLIHQVFAGVHIAMASEAMSIAAAAGLNTQETFDRLKNGNGNSWMFSNRVPPMFDPAHPSYSALSIIAKDVAIITSTARDVDFSLPLLSMAEQLYLQGLSSGWEKEDDCVMVRLYLPGRSSLVYEQTNATPGSAPPLVSVADVENLLIGVHLAVISEAMSFSQHLGIDPDLMFDIVSNAAGASAIFVKAFPDLRRTNWSLKGLPAVEQIRRDLSAAIAIGTTIRQPLFLSSAALQEFNRQLGAR